MPIDLTTGVPGSGKTLYTVAKVLQDYLASPVKNGDELVQRRLMVGGIPELLLPHEPIGVPTFDPEAPAKSDAPTLADRRPGDPPLDVERRADNWWLWCMPGDVIVVDECQRLFRPMPAGRKLPPWIAALETHRHYGVDFVLITQHPQLLHVNVRNLVGRHRHVRRMFGRAFTVIYEWDHCTSPDRTKNAVKTPWRYDTKAFGLYKSAELHTKHRHKLGVAFVVTLLVIPTAAFAWWYAIDRQQGALKPPAAKTAAAPAPGASSPRVAPAVAVVPPPALLPQQVISGGYCTASGCVCYSMAGYRHAVSSDGCRRWLANPPIDYWQTQAPRIEREADQPRTEDPST